MPTKIKKIPIVKSYTITSATCSSDMAMFSPMGILVRAIYLNNNKIIMIIKLRTIIILTILITIAMLIIIVVIIIIKALTINSKNKNNNNNNSILCYTA